MDEMCCVCVCAPLCTHTYTYTSARVGGFETRGLAVHHSAPLAETILSAGSLFSIPSCCTLMCFGLTTNWHPPSHLTLIKLLKDFHWTFDYLAFSIPYHFFFFFSFKCNSPVPRLHLQWRRTGIWGEKKKKKGCDFLEVQTSDTS